MIALVHEKLYTSDDPSLIDLSDYTRSLVDRLRGTLSRSEAVRIGVNADPVALSADRAVPVGLILNELISNAFKHAFPGERTGEIEVELRLVGEQQCLIRVRDNGVGVPEGLDITKTSSLGLQLVHGLAKQLNGTVELRREGGTIFEVKFAGVSGDKGTGSG
jgi:two-component sensor histidine kinase